MADRKVFISHTTRDERDRSLAHALADGLAGRGASVWIAPESIPAGDRWKEQVVAGVMDGCSHFLIILSAASVVSEEVLREIDMARRRLERDTAFRILPLVVGRELPDYDGKADIEALQLVPYHTAFDAQLDAVAVALGLTPVVPEAVRSFVSDKAASFVGRDYVFAAIDDFLDTNDRGYFVVEGDPGVGKSAILARFIQKTGCVAHFNSRALGITTAARFIENVCAQIIARFGLPYASLPANATRDGVFLAGLLAEAAETVTQDSPLIIAVDALDEVDLAGLTGNVLHLPPALPAGVYFLVTRRQTPVPLTAGVPIEVLDLSKFVREGKRDVESFVRNRVSASKDLETWIDSHGLSDDEFATTLARKSGGNFMYIRYILPDIERGRYPDLEIESLPAGLEAYYEDHWRRMGMNDRPLPRAKIRVVYVLSVARAPISRRLIARFARDEALAIDEIAVQEVLDEWDAFLHEDRDHEETRYSIYHLSFRDFLHRRDIVQAAGATIEGIHELFADRLWDDLFGAAPE